MWNAPHCSATSPSSTRADFASTSRDASAPYCSARSGTTSISGSSYWPMSAVYVNGIAPFSRIQATAHDVSRPPENAIPTFSPTGRELSTLDTSSSLEGRGAHASRERFQLDGDLLRRRAPGAITAGERSLDSEHASYLRGEVWRNGKVLLVRRLVE